MWTFFLPLPLGLEAGSTSPLGPDKLNRAERLGTRGAVVEEELVGTGGAGESSCFWRDRVTRARCDARVRGSMVIALPAELEVLFVDW
jgi:hypothetical protein